jgi:predicted HAD superfamily Cof-like phosphohydrolase
VTPAEMVAEFHRAFDCLISASPTVPSDEVRIGRARLIAEEAGEAIAELLAGMDGREKIHASLVAAFCIRSDPPDRAPDVAKVAHELADLAYVTNGGAHNWGVPLDAVVAEVHRANMSRLGEDGRPIGDFNGKVLKGPGYTPPDVVAVLGLT